MASSLRRTLVLRELCAASARQLFHPEPRIKFGAGFASHTRQDKN